MNICEAFDSALTRMYEKNWDNIYILVDIHGTVLKPSYHNKEQYEFYNSSQYVLQLLSSLKFVKLIMWTSSTQEAINNYLNVFENNGIHFDYVNENPEVIALSSDPNSSDFSNKYYFNIGFDDKFGFDPENDWNDLLKYLNIKFKNND